MRTNDPLRLATVCTGNICRSPMAEVVYRHLVNVDPHLRERVTVASGGTARWHVGSSMDPRAHGALRRAGFHDAGTPALFADQSFIAQHDLLVVMTREHRHDVLARHPGAGVVLLRELIEPGSGLDLEDPYYGDDSDFDRCLATIRESGPRLIEELRRRLSERSSEE